MNATRSTTKNKRKKQQRNRAIAILIIILIAAWAKWLFFSSVPSTTGTIKPASVLEVENRSETASDKAITISTPTCENLLPDNIYRCTIKDGDNLSAIFANATVDQTTLFQILDADESLLALDILRPGNNLTFTLDKETRQLEKMELFINPAHQVIYKRVDKNTFSYKEIILPGEWKSKSINSEISGSFYMSALNSGLTDQETVNITNLFQSKLNFSRDIRVGDHFQVVRSQQFVDGTPTGQSRIEAIRIFARKHCYTGFLFEDGNYYDVHAESLARAFRRYPFNGRHRISSPFNLRRKHPITGRISPHKGTDFAMPIGTPIYATADGVVKRVKNHPFAGKYIEIKHDGRYATRYLHLSRITVRRGQKVQRGERIAMSGNTGRSTGPHLHYELHIKGRAVNPLTAKIPMAASVPKNKITAFNKRVANLIAMMEPKVEISSAPNDGIKQ